jgi:hypothetical protein
MRQRRAEFDAARRKRFVRGQKSQERNRRRFVSSVRQEQQESVEEQPLPHDDEEDQPSWRVMGR